MNAVDTNIFVYAHDDDEVDKQPKAIELLDRLVQNRSETVLLWQVVGEFLNCVRRWQLAGRIVQSDVEADVRDLFLMFPLILPNRNVIEHALDLGSRHSLSHWDSMLLGACIDAGVDTLFTEDLDAATTYDSVKIVNPFD